MNPRFLQIIYALGIAMPVGVLLTIPIWMLMGVELHVLSYGSILIALWAMVNYNPLFAELWNKLKDHFKR